jgi:hypothetical protein
MPLLLLLLLLPMLLLAVSLVQTDVGASSLLQAASRWCCQGPVHMHTKQQATHNKGQQQSRTAY